MYCFAPISDMFETAESIIIQVELVGVKKQDIGITLANSYLEVTGIKKRKGITGDESFQRMERPFGFFKRVFDLPDNINANSATASFNDGLLEIVVLKRSHGDSFTLSSVDIK